MEHRTKIDHVLVPFGPIYHPEVAGLLYFRRISLGSSKDMKLFKPALFVLHLFIEIIVLFNCFQFPKAHSHSRCVNFPCIMGCIMGLNHLLTAFLAFFLVNCALSSPVDIERVHLQPRSSLGNLDRLHKEYKGIWLQQVSDTCSRSEALDITQAIDTAVSFMKQGNRKGVDITTTPGWNRYFVADSNVPSGKGWKNVRLFIPRFAILAPQC
jgi:hypothetical protein